MNSELQFIKECWDFTIDTLYDHFDESRSNSIFNTLVNLYSDPRRKYHNLTHLYKCLKSANQNASIKGEKDAAHVMLAFFFHDAIYSASSGGYDEKMSAKLLTSLMPSFIGMHHAVKMIELSASHFDNNDIAFVPYKVFLKTDLEILDSDKVEYTQYSIDIIEEYMLFHNLPESEIDRVMEGRIEFLIKLIESDILNYKAIENVQREIDSFTS